MFRQRTIRGKLILVLFIAASLTLASVSATFLLLEHMTLEKRALQIMAPYAQLVSVGAEAAVAFEDSARAQEILETLRAAPQILGAQIILGDNKVLAGYGVRPDEKIAPDPGTSDGVSVHIDRHAVVLIQKLRDGAHLYLATDLDEINRQTRNTWLVFAAVMAVLLGIVSLGLMAALQRVIVLPIATLARTVKQIHARADYKQRVPAAGTDEVALLGQNFNAMMGAIEAQEDALRQNKDQLEKTVQQRTAELLAARDEAQAANQAKSAFLATMSHELRTPLNGILGYAQILQRDASLDDKQLRGMDVILQGGEQLLNLINDILDFAKIEASKFELYSTPLALTEFLRAVTDIVAVKARQKGLGFISDIAADLPVAIQADERRLRQVLLNLLMNAVKFTERGQVALQVRFSPPARLRFEVSDSGIGIAGEELHAIFEPFEQAGDRQQRLGGTGLGLAISRQLLRLMGSEIHVDSQVGHGSTFWFEMDVLVLKASAMPSPQAVVNGYEGPRKTVLLVDDVSENRMALSDMLGPLGFTMREATNGSEALEQARALRPDLILMDIVMPGMDGLDAMRLLRRLPDGRDTPIIAISASAYGGDAASSLEAGASAFLPKPIGLERLLSQIGALLELEWTVVSPDTQLAREHTEPKLVVPPAPEMAILHHLAMVGNMHDILQRASSLIELDECYRPFAEQLALLARSYRSREILTLVLRYVDQGPGLS